MDMNMRLRNAYFSFLFIECMMIWKWI